MDVRYSLVGLLIGLLIGLTGMGGGSLLTPILILIFRVPPVWAVGTDVTYSAVTKALGSVMHIRQKGVNFKLAFWLACGSIPATLLSVVLVQELRRRYESVVDGVVLHAIGGTLILVALLLLVKPWLLRRIEQRGRTAQKPAALASEGSEPASPKGRWRTYARPVVVALIGAFVGFLVGLTSVGSGTLIVVSLALLFPRLTSKELVGTDIFQAFMLLAAGAVGYISAGTVNWSVVGLLLFGSLPGVYLGSKLTQYIPEPYMRPVLAFVLFVSGWKLV
jgi:uncharacterized membrane protein YfcA